MFYKINMKLGGQTNFKEDRKPPLPPPEINPAYTLHIQYSTHSPTVHTLKTHPQYTMNTHPSTLSS